MAPWTPGTSFLTWHDYFVTVAQASATLEDFSSSASPSGSIICSGRGYLYRAWAALFLAVRALLIGLFGVIPDSRSRRSEAIVAAGLAILGCDPILGTIFPEDEASTCWVRRAHAWCAKLLLHRHTFCP